MTKVLNRIGDRIVGALLKQEEAGACRVCPGPCAYRDTYVCKNNMYFLNRCYYDYTCDCGCIISYCEPTYLGPC